MARPLAAIGVEFALLLNVVRPNAFGPTTDCSPGYAGPNCTACPAGSWAAGYQDSLGSNQGGSCTPCNNGYTTPGDRSTSDFNCSGEPAGAGLCHSARQKRLPGCRLDGTVTRLRRHHAAVRHAGVARVA